MFNKNKTIADLRQRLRDEETRHELIEHKLRGEINDVESRAKFLQDQLIDLTNEYAKLTSRLQHHQPSSPEPTTPEPSQLSKPIIDVNLNDYVILRPDSYPCKECPFEHTPCKKLSFHDRTICITHKDNVKDTAPK